MSISRQNLSIVIVTLKSEKVVHNCIKSINQDISIIVVENSNNHRFKEEMELKYKNLKCILSGSNLGMGAGNNIGIKEAKTDYVLILNPDVILEDNTLDELILTSNKIPDFAILAPKEKNIINYGMFKKKISIEQNSKEVAFKVDFVDGFAMLINKKKFQNNKFFDEKFFMFFVIDDLCNRAIVNGDTIYVIPKAKI
jgi:GT2 family glycosyltransferase